MKYSKIFFKLNLLNSLIKFFVKRGRKASTLKSVMFSFYMLAKLTEQNISFLVVTLCNSLDTSVRIKRVYLRKRTLIIPRFIKYKKRLFLIFSWLMKSIYNHFEFRSLWMKFIYECLLVLYEDENSVALIAKNENFLTAKTYKSNAHYRW